MQFECLKYADCGLVKKEKGFVYKSFAVYKNWTNIGFERYVKLHVICKHLNGFA